MHANVTENGHMYIDMLALRISLLAVVFINPTIRSANPFNCGWCGGLYVWVTPSSSSLSLMMSDINSPPPSLIILTILDPSRWPVCVELRNQSTTSAIIVAM
eukprot:2357665-Amphidinium_carterae.1